MQIKKLDVINLTNNHQYVVVSIINYNNKFYAYLIDMADKKNVLFAEVFDDYIAKVDDQDLLKELLPLFYDDSMSSLASFSTNE